MKSSLKDVAQLANVSIATASLALNGKPVNEVTRESVLRAAKKLNYVAMSAGRSLKSGKSFVIGIFIFNSHRYENLMEVCSYYYKLLLGVFSESDLHDYSVMVENVYWEGGKGDQLLFRKISSGAIDGVIIIPQFSYPYTFLSYLHSLDFPYVICNPVEDIPPSHVVALDNESGASMAAEYLITRGRRKIGMVTGPVNHNEAVLRINGYNRALEKHRIGIRPEWTIEADFTISGGYKAGKQLFTGTKEYPDGILCGNDYTAAGLMRVVHERGLRIPDDIAVIGFDNNEVCIAVYPALTTIENPTYEIGVRSARRLVEVIEKRSLNDGNRGEGAEDSALAPVILEPKLIVRESV